MEEEEQKGNTVEDIEKLKARILAPLRELEEEVLEFQQQTESIKKEKRDMYLCLVDIQKEIQNTEERQQRATEEENYDLAEELNEELIQKESQIRDLTNDITEKENQILTNEKRTLENLEKTISLREKMILELSELEVSPFSICFFSIHIGLEPARRVLKRLARGDCNKKTDA